MSIFNFSIFVQSISFKGHNSITFFYFLEQSPVHCFDVVCCVLIHIHYKTLQRQSNQTCIYKPIQTHRSIRKILEGMFRCEELNSFLCTVYAVTLNLLF